MFRYGSLRPNRREIRLARFVMAPNGSHGNSGFQLQLATASLNDATSYHALSYVWGDPTPIFPITVDGECFKISGSLHFALGQLSKATPLGVWLWIDAICIDQSNVEERSWQVGQMQDIFQTAESVYVSLGESGEQTDLLLNLIHSFGHEAMKAGVLELWASFSHGGYRKLIMPHNPEEHPALNFLPKVLDYSKFRDTRVLSAIQGLLDRPNWFRAWVMQELALARSGQILCGEQKVSLDAFHSAITAIYFAKISGFARQQPQWKDFGLGLNNNHFHIQGLISRLRHLQGKRFSLLELLLSEMRGADDRRPFYAASDPRDIIFALLGVASDTEALNIRPDYRKTVQQVYAEATKAMIMRCSYYRLEYCTFPKDIPGLPSWVPDWQRIGRLGVVHPLSYRNNFHASRGRTQPLSTDTSVPTLQRRGIMVDSVGGVFRFDETEISEHDAHVTSMTLAKALESKARRTGCLKSILDFAGPYLKDNASESNLWRLMLGGLMGTDKRTWEFDSLALRAFRQEAVAADSINELQLEYILQNSYPYPRKLKEGEDLQSLVDQFCERIVLNAAVMARRRTLFVTLRGALGLGSYRVRDGDAVTILFGTQVPIILRPAGAAYTYVGDAYVDGAMKGECMAAEYEELGFEII